MSHIELARWADFILIAPATADFIARLTHGRPTTSLRPCASPRSAPIAVAPAMNRLMWSNAATQSNIAQLHARGVHVLGPDSGSQACGETGEGRMLEPADIAAATMALLPAEGPLRAAECCSLPGLRAKESTRCVSSATAVRERWASPWRGRARSRRRRSAGGGPVNLCAPPGVSRICVESAPQMHDAVMQEIDGIEIFIATAAVADYRPGQAGRVQDQENPRQAGHLHGTHRRHPGRRRAAAGSAFYRVASRRKPTMSKNTRWPTSSARTST